MASFDEYAALARQLHELRRAEERTAAATSQRHDVLVAGADQLGQRLAAQRQRLHQIAQAIGEPPPALEVDLRPVAGPGPTGWSGVPGQAMPPGQPPPSPGGPYPVLPAPEPHPALPGPGAHPALPVAPTRLALPADPAQHPGRQPASPTQLPGQRPAPPASAPAGAAPSAGPVPAPRPAPVDPAQALELARRAADAADQSAMRAETMAQQPPLLPGWSPIARALVIYGGFALLAVAMGVLLFHQLDTRAEKEDFGRWFSAIAWAGGGLPTLAFFAGYLVLNVWGKPRMAVGKQPSAHLRIGFLICFVVVPLAACVLGAFPVLAEGPGG
ncbi:hypothetical protein GCM10027280_43650 [Micromonospora polyrhachis]|uniref:Uncharacterized protein n=1 Tax=Micromonospora polyrhachis TaxID=1282883 RepID=A0A7W7SUW7_9ACTN|nr:hypothetical protein [Micromonospora polyrhachis]MBB4961374.1 hypothetical protein [Micromonospora polyrhachis]